MVIPAEVIKRMRDVVERSIRVGEIQIGSSTVPRFVQLEGLESLGMLELSSTPQGVVSIIWRDVVRM